MNEYNYECITAFEYQPDGMGYYYYVPQDCASYVYGCNQEGACNYNPDANINDDSCFYPCNNTGECPETGYSCYGNCIDIAECGSISYNLSYEGVF